MAAKGARGVRLNPKHDERTRAKIQTSQIINRLESFVEGKVDMSAPQVTAALGLLRKTLPDLQATEISGQVEQRYVARIPEPVTNTGEWLKQQSPMTH